MTAYPLEKAARKKLYFNEMCLVLSSGFLDSVTAMQFVLHYKTLYFIFCFEYPMSNTSLISQTNVVNGSSSLIPMISDMCSDSQVDRVISDCNLLFECIGMLEYHMKQHVRDERLSTLCESWTFHPQEKSASVHN